MTLVNFLDNSIIYITQGYKSVRDNKKIYYGDYFLTAQVNECASPPEDLENYVCQDREVRLFRPRYDPVIGNFLCLYEALGYFMVRGDPEVHFLDYGYSKQNSKIWHSHYKTRIPSSFSRTSLIAIGSSLNLPRYRPHFQMFIIFFLWWRIGVKK